MKVLTGDDDITVGYVEKMKTAIIRDNLLDLQVAVCIEDVPELIELLKATYEENFK